MKEKRNVLPLGVKKKGIVNDIRYKNYRLTIEYLVYGYSPVEVFYTFTGQYGSYYKKRLYDLISHCDFMGDKWINSHKYFLLDENLKKTTDELKEILIGKEVTIWQRDWGGRFSTRVEFTTQEELWIREEKRRNNEEADRMNFEWIQEQLRKEEDYA